MAACGHLAASRPGNEKLYSRIPGAQSRSRANPTAALGVCCRARSATSTMARSDPGLLSTGSMNWLNVAAGLGVGLLVGITGVGGGSLMTPILVLLFGIAPATAVGTDLWFAAITKIVGGAAGQSRGRVDWRVVRRLALGSLPASVLTLLWMHQTGTSQVTRGVTLKALGIVLVLTALAMLFTDRIADYAKSLRIQSQQNFARVQPVMTVVAGAILGVLVTLTSVGAGALGTVMLRYLYPLRMKPSVLVATDIVHAIPLVLIAGSGYLLLGDVNLPLLGQLLLGSIPGILIGSFISGRAPDRVLRIAIALALIAVSYKLLRA
jgi:uncharacterized protein